ncbi:Asp-tRNA(Asn)/Glu-tRNA(Gln) amidotransferase GatCAB subunit A [Candidatus Kaiserbacteria bacterium CG10_big_fil_rev_8_21_14_0_10_59_10]|uniref:Glutamyl-tRNA(Gln) amidotransferase subunit A n=1 Tax=Candidatus Kaiserbacteria bacterium CG10_big_fil_rev_8_21_14_0_10_59_10 TaxID=1974612 RepID=A0A2H0U887_9BACT|nr:MAG: Asp-tRNA(Asn)/Glu-tRNA(Gln) amidotransferase GatCAB subunit A [Candidatus Kaiserbacteria bacterium CG10_big_fil_rev_8_21_14_0_10_59_10]
MDYSLLTDLTIAEARRALDAKECSALELADAYLEAIKEKDGEIHAYLEVWEEAARAEARAADAQLSAGTGRALTGIPLALKDNILVEGRTASAASKILENYAASYDATVTKKLKEQSVVFLGRTNMDEFAMGSSTENSAYGPTKNPHDVARVPGGSSGGSAAAVAARLCAASLGSDTGGSIRQPAALCGVVGLYPTYGSVSRFGLIAMGSSLDQIGPLARTVEDAGILFNAICGHDPRDSTSIPATGNRPPATKRIGVPRDFLGSGIEADVLENFEKTLARLREKGYEVRDITLPNIRHSLAVYYIVMPAEASTNLARYDGIRYGLSSPAEDIAGVYAKTRGEGFGLEVRRRILVGTFVLSAGYADAYYRRALGVRARIRREFAEALDEASGVDVIATPTTPAPAFKLGEKADPLSMYAADIFTVPVNLAGIPAISVPNGSLEREGKTLPTAIQFIGRPRDESTLFAVGVDVEKTSG